MKKLLAILLCAIAAAGAADARTLYVNASRPNNNGNGLKPATAKKTIQAAINIANKGDTILVYPGTYDPIKTNNKKIAIKSVKGKTKTKIVAGAIGSTVANLGKHADFWQGESAGNSTALSGFLLDGRYRDAGIAAGGKLSSCTLQRLGTIHEEEGIRCVSYSHAAAAIDSVLVQCVIRQNQFVTTDWGLLRKCVLSRCVIRNNRCHGQCGAAMAGKCTLANCLVVRNDGDFGAPVFSDCRFVNCTIAQNVKDGGWGERFSTGSQYNNCILWNNFDREIGAVHNVDSTNTYSRTYKDNRNPKFANASKDNYNLKKGSPCINRGKLNASLKKLVGTKDLAGKKRIRGKALDMGCYEY